MYFFLNIQMFWPDLSQDEYLVAISQGLILCFMLNME